MSTAETAEFTAFGPWVDDVTDAAGVPRLYRDFPLDFAKAELVLKVPRNIARRDAHPGMDLYDALLIVDAEATTVLSRQDDTYTTRTVPHAALVAIVDSVLLLDGRLVLHVDEGEPLEITYNGSSQGVMSRLATVLRRLSPTERDGSSVLASAGHPTGEIGALDGERDYALLGAWRELAGREPAVTLAGAHGSRLLPPAGGLVARLVDRLRPSMLTAAVVGTSPDGCHVLHRRRHVDTGKTTDLSLVHTFLFPRPTARIEHRAHPRFADLRIIEIVDGDARIEFVVPDGSTTEATLIRAR